MTGFRRIGEEPIWRGQVISLANATFEAPDGTRFDREVIHHPGAVSVVPVLGDGHTVVMVRQYRAALDREILEIPAGKRDVPGEAPEISAGRELAEEVGFRAGKLEQLGAFYNSAGFCDEHSLVYLATDLTPCETRACGVEELHMTIERLDLDDVPRLIADGALVDAKTVIGLLLARNRLRR